MTIILGIDPGSRITGYGIIEYEHNQFTHIDHGIIKTNTDCLSERLHLIYQGINKVIESNTAEIVAIEQVFFARNPQSALKLGQARGAAITACANNGLHIAEYAARQIKQAVVGYGAASKNQIQQMIKILLKLSTTPPPDAADALAVAVCHCHLHAVVAKLERARITAGEGS